MGACSLGDILTAMQGERTAAIFYRTPRGIVSKTHADLYNDAAALRRAFSHLGVETGRIVAIHGETSYSWLVADVACILGGFISLALYPSAPRERICSAVKETRASILITDDY